MAEAVYKLVTSQGEFLATRDNTIVHRYFPSSLIDHIEIAVADKTIIGYCAPELLDDMEKEGFAAVAGYLATSDVDLALDYFNDEIDVACNNPQVWE